MDQSNSNAPQKTSDIVLQRALDRVAPVLTKGDVMTLESFKTDGFDRERVQQFLLTKVPHFHAILEEEMEYYKAEQGKM